MGRIRRGLTALLLGLTALAAAAEQRIVEAAFAAGPGAPAAAAWQPVSLPDAWRRHEGPRPAAASYRLAFDVAAVPEEPWALRFEQASAHLRLELNGQVVATRGEEQAEVHAVRFKPALLVLPPALLRAGRNELIVRVEHGLWPRAGLGVAEVGEWRRLAPRHDRYLAWQVDLPKALNLVAMALAVGLLGIWWRRRVETALALFGVLYMLTSLRNYAYVADPLVPVRLGDWMLYASVAVSSLLLAQFALTYAQLRAPRLVAVGRVALWALPLAGALAALADPAALNVLRVATYPPLLGVAAFACAVLTHAAWRDRRPSRVAMAAGFFALAAASFHDAALAAGALGVEAVFWNPFVAPLVLAAFSVTLVDRMLRVMHEAETLRATLEARVAERTRELGEANAAKSRFLAAASHDLRQPLHAIGLMASLLRDQLPSHRTLAHRIELAVEGMGTLLTGLLDLSRLDAGAVEPAIEALGLAEVFAQVRLVATPAAGERGLELRIAPTRLRVRSDRALLASIVGNLVANAIAYTPSGKVLVGARRRGDKVVIQVHDTGVGIAQGELARIFEAFYRGASTRADRPQGIGLGLAIVRRSAAILDHGVRVRSTPGRGTVFEVELPGVGTTSPPGDAQRLREPSAPRLAGAFVAVVEDHAPTREALAAWLRGWGCACEAAADPEALLAALDAHLRLPDLLLCDLRLGGDGDGVDAVRLLRAQLGQSIPALLVTGDNAPAELERIRQSGLPVLFKPVVADVLLMALQAMLAAGMPTAGEDPGARPPAPPASGS